MRKSEGRSSSALAQILPWLRGCLQLGSVSKWMSQWTPMCSVCARKRMRLSDAFGGHVGVGYGFRELLLQLSWSPYWEDSDDKQSSN